MTLLYLILQFLICFCFKYCEGGSSEHIIAKRSHLGNHTHDEMKAEKIRSITMTDKDSVDGTEAAVLLIVGFVIMCVIMMVIYFVRKFDQLNRNLPTYRYSALKTEVNGYGLDPKSEADCLVNVSTEEEEDQDDSDYEDDLVLRYDHANISPPTLLVQSQTVMSTSANGSLPKISVSTTFPKSVESSVDSDDELLQ